MYRERGKDIMKGWVYFDFENNKKVFVQLKKMQKDAKLLALFTKQETLRFAVIDNELEEKKFQFGNKQKVVYAFELWQVTKVLKCDDNEQWITRNAVTIRVKKIELRPVIVGNRSVENKHITTLYNSTKKRTIDCILLHYSITEGKSFKRIRQIHIMEPMEPMEDAAQWEQVVARAVRKDSHKYIDDKSSPVIYSKPYVEVVQWHAFVPGFKNIPGERSAMAMLTSNDTVGQKSLQLLTELGIPTFLCLIMDMFDFGSGEFTRINSGSYSDGTPILKRILKFLKIETGEQTDNFEDSWSRRWGNIWRNWTGHWAADIYDEQRVSQQKTENMKTALRKLKELWEKTK